MKKTGYIVLIIMGTLLGLPFLNYMGNIMMAANSSNSPEPWGEKVVDLQISLNQINRSMTAFLITEDRHLYVWVDGDRAKPIEDSNGAPLTNVIQTGSYPYSSTQYNLIALRDDGTLYVSGDNSNGRFGNGTNTNTVAANIPFIVNPGIDNIVQVCATASANYILTANGELYASGDNSQGQLGNGTTTSSNTWTKVNISDVKKIQKYDSGGMYALTNNGKIFAWGASIHDGTKVLTNVNNPVPVYDSTGNIYDNVIDINSDLSGNGGYASLGVLAAVNGKMQGSTVGGIYAGAITIDQIDYGAKLSYGYTPALGVLTNGNYYIQGLNSPYSISNVDLEGKILIASMTQTPMIVTKSGALFYNGNQILVGADLKVKGEKKDSTVYKDSEKYNDDITIIANYYTSSSAKLTCGVEDKLSGNNGTCSDYINEKIAITLGTDRIYRTYKFSNGTDEKSLTVDLYKEKPELNGYSKTTLNKIKVTDNITIAAPSSQANWNTYSAVVTDSSGNTRNFTGGTLTEGTYTLTVKDSYGNTQDYQFEAKDIPTPVLGFTPISSTLTYGDNPTKANNIIGNFTLQYPAGKPTSTIKTIQLGNSGDESHFSIDTSGALKVKGSNLDAGTYSVTATGTDGNGVSFTKTVSITVNKKDQNNYQITNNANYPLQVNQEINITTSGNESGENETYTITNGSNVAQIVGNKFKLLSSGAFTLQVTVGGNTNYNSKTVTKQITVSQLPTQNPPVSITSSDSFIYGNTYTPAYSGGQGSGAVAWKIENDNGTGAVLSNGSVKVTGIGTFTLKVTKAGTSSYQESTATKVITVNKRRTTVKPKDVTKTVGQAFKDNGATYTPQPISGDNLGTLTITSKYTDNQVPGRYTDGIQASGLSNPNYEFVYQDGTLIINSNALPNNGDGYYKVTGTKGKNNWYVSDVQISATGKNGYDEISKDGISFQTSALVYSTDGDYPTEFYLKNSSTGIIAKAIRYQLKIDQTPPDVPSLSMKEINKNAIAKFINALSFGNWMNQGVQVTMTSTDGTSGIDHYEYTETSQSGANTKTSTNGIVTYNSDVELTVKAKACDKAGNCSALSSDESIMIDTKAPTITGVKDKSEYKHYYLPRFVNVKDSYSGLSYSEYKKDGTMAGTTQNNVEEQIGEVGEYEVYAIDNAGNEVTISFKIVPLPDIEKEIDGSDESKDIIDQVIDELDEIKDKIDETEKKDIEDWIKDALDKWNSLRKKVIETDDKSAKVEGQGDTSFDPSVKLIVDEISENDIPPLPKKAIAVYDVWLQKGNIKIQPDGSIKVYLPYTETNIGNSMGGAVDSLAMPIVYQIDNDDHVIQLKVKREGNFVTFITDKLLRYAISNDNQKCPLDGIEINVDSDGDGKPDVNIDIDGDCKADLNIDTDGDGQPNTNIDTDLDGKPDYNIDTNGDGKPDINIGPINEPFKPTVCKTVNGLEYCSDPYKKPYLNIDSDGDGRPDINIDLDGDMEADINIDIDGDNIPDLDIDTDGDGKPDINIDTDQDGKADKNIVKLSEWKPDKNVDGSIKYDTMSGLMSLLEDNSDNDINGQSKPLGGATTGTNTGDTNTPFLWWIIVLINMIIMIYCVFKVRKEKEQER